MESREERKTDRSDVKLNRESEHGVRRGGGETGEAWRCRENKGWKPASERERERVRETERARVVGVGRIGGRKGKGGKQR